MEKQKEIPCKKGLPTCLFNEGVGCPKQKCETCGWNPAVAKARLTIIRKRLGV